MKIIHLLTVGCESDYHPLVSHTLISQLLIIPSRWPALRFSQKSVPPPLCKTSVAARPFSHKSLRRHESPPMHHVGFVNWSGSQRISTIQCFLLVIQQHLVFFVVIPSYMYFSRRVWGLAHFCFVEIEPCYPFHEGASKIVN